MIYNSSNISKILYNDKSIVSAFSNGLSIFSTGPSLPAIVANGLTFWLHGADFPTSSATANTLVSRSPQAQPLNVYGWDYTPTNGNRGDGYIYSGAASNAGRIILDKAAKYAALPQSSFTVQVELDFTGFTWSELHGRNIWEASKFSASTRSNGTIEIRGFRGGTMTTPNLGATPGKVNIAITWTTATGATRLYVNGVYKNAYYYSSPYFSAWDSIAVTDHMGFMNSSSGTDSFAYAMKGGMKEVLFYNRPLTDAEVLTNYNITK